jgi:hypothetical protein
LSAHRGPPGSELRRRRLREDELLDIGEGVALGLDELDSPGLVLEETLTLLGDQPEDLDQQPVDVD